MLNRVCPGIGSQKNFMLVCGKYKSSLVTNQLASGGEWPDLGKIFSSIDPSILDSKIKMAGFGSFHYSSDSFVHPRDVNPVRNYCNRLLHFFPFQYRRI